MRREWPGHTLETTALLHEAYLRLLDADISWQDRVHFFSVAASQMRRILVDHARARASARRGGTAVKLPLDEGLVVSPERFDELVEIDEVLERLSAWDSRKARVVELHFFGGLTYEEIGEVVGVSLATVRRDMRIAKAWLKSELAKHGG